LRYADLHLHTYHSDGTRSPREVIDLARERGITTTPARGHKCGRCWLYREEVAQDGDLCERCERVVATLAPAEAPTV
jgi:hypothetical protein